MFYPVFFDTANNINKLNKFNPNAKYQCFLLDKNNKVVFVGNPTYSYAIWQLYKKTIDSTVIQ
jgi:lipocalin